MWRAGSSTTLLGLVAATALLVGACAERAPASIDGSDSATPPTTHGPDTPVPEADPDNQITGVERAEIFAACMREHGVAAEVQADFTVYDVPPGQDKAYEAFEQECGEDLDHAYPIAPLGPEEHYYALLELAACLRDIGYDIPDAPSVDRFVETYHEEGAWDPNLFARPRSAEKYEDMVHACPTPP